MPYYFHAVYLHADGCGFVGRVEELPQIAVTGETIEATERELQEAVLRLFENNRRITRSRYGGVVVLRAPITVTVGEEH